MQHIEDMIKQVDYSRGTDLEVRLGERIAAVQAERTATIQTNKKKVSLRELESQEKKAHKSNHASLGAAERRRNRHREIDPPEKKGPKM